MGKKDRKKAHCHDYSGSCVPQMNQFSYAKTFSVGIFEWVPTTSSAGLKKSAVVYRVRGYCIDADKVYARAEEVCDMFDSGRKPPHKSEFVK